MKNFYGEALRPIAQASSVSSAAASGAVRTVAR